METVETEDNFLNLKKDDFIIFKKEVDDDEECAKIVIKYETGYGVKQYFGGLIITGEVLFKEILRKADINEIKTVKGSEIFDILSRKKPNYKRQQIVGFESNITKSRNT